MHYDGGSAMMKVEKKLRSSFYSSEGKVHVNMSNVMDKKYDRVYNKKEDV